VTVWSLAAGLLVVGVWSLANAWLGANRELPGVLAGAVWLWWPMRRGMTSLAGLTSRDAASRSLTLAVLAVLAVFVVANLRMENYYDNDPLWWWLAWVRPHEQHFRVLILAPLWGAWMMLVAPRLGRSGPANDLATRALADSCGPVLSAVLLAVPLGLTVFYFRWMGWWIFIPTVLPLAAAVVAPMALCRRRVLDRRALLAASAVTQLTFFLAYLAGRHCWNSFRSW